MKKRLIFVLVLVVCIAASMPSYGKSTKVYKIKIASWYDPSHPVIKSLELLKSNLDERTKGAIKISIFPSSQLGSEETFEDSVKAGTVEMGIAGTMISTYSPLVALSEKPFLFDNWDHARTAFLKEGVGDIMGAETIKNAGFRVIAWSVNGWRMISCSKPINSFEDLKGIKLRVPNIPLYLQMAKGWGCNVTPMSFSELFTALEQKVVDGQDNPYATVKASSFYEVQKYMVNSAHIFSPNPWIINEKFYQSLPDDLRKTFDECIAEANVHNWKISQQVEEETVQFLKDNGVTIVYPDAEFKKKLRDSQKANDAWWYENYPGSEELEKKIKAIQY